MGTPSRRDPRQSLPKDRVHHLQNRPLVERPGELRSHRVGFCLPRLPVREDGCIVPLRHLDGGSAQTSR
jgi:hypothetical protein